MINFNFGGGFGGFNIDMFDLDVEIFIGDTSAGKQHLSAPYQMVFMECQEVVNNVAHDERPMKVVFYGKKQLNLPNGNLIEKPARLLYANNKYIENFGENFV